MWRLAGLGLRQARCHAGTLHLMLTCQLSKDLFSDC